MNYKFVFFIYFSYHQIFYFIEQTIQMSFLFESVRVTGMRADDIARGWLPLAGHSLSWRDEKNPSLGPNRTMFAKTWIPEDPTKHKAKQESCDDVMQADSTISL